MAKAISSANNYHRWIFDSFRRFLVTDAVTLEVGIGHGEFTKLLAGVSKKVIATDINQEAVTKVKDELKYNGNVEVLDMDGIEIHKIHGLVDNIVAINILEHIKDDKGFIANGVKILRSGGRLVVFVPAFRLLFSDIDKQAGHFKRYSKKELSQILADNDFKLVYSHYFNFVGFWGWLINKPFHSDLDSISTNLQVKFFNRFIFLFKFFDIFSFFCGQSLLVIGEKI